MPKHSRTQWIIVAALLCAVSVTTIGATGLRAQVGVLERMRLLLNTPQKAPNITPPSPSWQFSIPNGTTSPSTGAGYQGPSTTPQSGFGTPSPQGPAGGLDNCTGGATCATQISSLVCASGMPTLTARCAANQGWCFTCPQTNGGNSSVASAQSSVANSSAKSSVASSVAGPTCSMSLRYVASRDYAETSHLGEFALIDAQYAYFTRPISVKEGERWHGANEIIKLRLSDFAEASRTPIRQLEREGSFMTGALDPTTGIGYYASSSYDGRLYKIRMSDLSVLAAQDFEDGEYELSGAGHMVMATDPKNGYVYLATKNRISRFLMSDLSRAGAIDLDGYEIRVESAVVDASGTHAYFGTYGGILKIDLATFTKAGFERGNDYNFRGLALDEANGLGYAAGSVGINRFNLSDLKNTGRVEPSDYQAYNMSALVLDPVSRHLFATTHNVNYQTVIFAVRLSDFTLAGNIKPPLGNPNQPGNTALGYSIITSAVFDNATGNIYVGSKPNARYTPVRVSKIATRASQCTVAQNFSAPSPSPTPTSSAGSSSKSSSAAASAPATTPQPTATPDRMTVSTYFTNTWIGGGIALSADGSTAGGAEFVSGYTPQTLRQADYGPAIMDTRTREATMLPKFPVGLDSFKHWTYGNGYMRLSGDGRYALLMAYGPTKHALLVYDRDSKTYTEIPYHADAGDAYLSKDGNTIMYARKDTIRKITPVVNGGVRTDTAVFSLNSATETIDLFTISDDASQIYFGKFISGQAQKEYTILNIATGKKEILTEIVPPLLSGDFRSIASSNLANVIRNPNGTVKNSPILIDRETAATTELLKGTKYEGYWAIVNGLSADGRYVFFRAHITGPAPTYQWLRFDRFEKTFVGSDAPRNGWDTISANGNVIVYQGYNEQRQYIGYYIARFDD